MILKSVPNARYKYIVKSGNRSFNDPQLEFRVPRPVTVTLFSLPRDELFTSRKKQAAGLLLL